MAVRFQLRRDTLANWASFNPILNEGEPGIEIDTGKLKIGDGSTAWSSLVYTTDFNQIENTPTTLAGYGITDAATSAQGTLADSSVQPADNISVLTNNLGFITNTVPNGTSVKIQDTTATTTTTTGALTVAGGLGVAGNINMGSALGFTTGGQGFSLSLNTSGQLVFLQNVVAGGTFSGTPVLTLDDDGGVSILGGALSAGNTSVGTLDVSGIANFNNTTNSTSTTTGAVVIDGGVGIAGDIHLADLKQVTWASGTFVQGTTTGISLGGVGGLVSISNNFIAFDGAPVVFERQTVERTATNPSISGGVETHNLSAGGGLFYATTPTADWTANFTNVYTSNEYTVSVAIIIEQGSTAYMPTAVQIDGTPETILWQGGSAPTGTASGIDIVSFSLIRIANAWKVIGSATSYS